MSKTPDQNQIPDRLVGRRWNIVIAIFAVAVGTLWVFPRVWYTKSDDGSTPVWLGEQTNLVEWAWTAMPVSESAERVLVADRLISGGFTSENGKPSVQVFSAKRYTEKSNDIGLFVHTPDRCWTESGWGFEPVSPDAVEVEVHGVDLVFERRVFTHGSQRELVYFGGLVGGQPVPYRLDHNMSVGMRYAKKNGKSGGGATALRAADPRFWGHVWDSFLSRRQILGPKQFIRVSTSLSDKTIEEADALLGSFLSKWLQPSDYDAELASWEEESGNRRESKVDSRPQ